MIEEPIYRILPVVLRKGNLGGNWRASQETMPSGELPFLTSDAVAEHCDLAGFEVEAVPHLQLVAARIGTEVDLKCLAWHCHYLLCQSRSDSRDVVRHLELLGEFAGVFYLLIALFGVSYARAFHQSRGIPEQIARDTYSDTSLWAQGYKTKHGVWGVDLKILPWLFNHISGELYRLGRLHFMQRPLQLKLHAFRNRVTQEVKALATVGIRYRGDGGLDGTVGEFDTESGWISRLIIDSDRVTGTPIHPGGVALRTEITLSLNTWEQILAPGDSVLETHIPAGSPMDFDACGDSFHQAIDFFPRYFPDRLFQGFCCTSWLLNTQFQEWLSPDSNLVRFQREFYLFPIFSGGRSGLDRIFNDGMQDLSKAPRNTSLRRTVLNHLQAGGYLRSGGALLFVEDLDWGTQVYQRRLE